MYAGAYFYFRGPVKWLSGTFSLITCNLVMIIMYMYIFLNSSYRPLIYILNNIISILNITHNCSYIIHIYKYTSTPFIVQLFNKHKQIWYRWSYSLTPLAWIDVLRPTCTICRRLNRLLIYTCNFIFPCIEFYYDIYIEQTREHKSGWLAILHEHYLKIVLRVSKDFNIYTNICTIYTSLW